MMENDATVKFVIGTWGLATRCEAYSWDEWLEMLADNNVPANTTYTEIEVRSEEDMLAYIEAENQYLRAIWTPNQRGDPDEYYANMRSEAIEQQRKLRINCPF